MRQLATLLALVLAVGLAACGSDDGERSGGSGSGGAADGGASGAREPALSPAALGGRRFVAGPRAVRGHALVAGTSVTLSFDGARLGADAGCNKLGAAYQLTGGRLRLDGEPSQTMIGCPPDRARQDEWLSGFLASGPRATLDGERLTLSSGGVTLVLTEGRQAGAPPLVGTRWVLETIAEGGGADGSASSVPAGVRAPALTLTADGRAELFAGCNQGGASATVRDDGFVDFGPFTLTDMACDTAAMELEQTVGEVLAGSVAAGFEGERLSLSKDGRSLVFTAR